MSKNVAMFVDVANMYYAARGQDVDVDYVALLKHATKGRDLIRAYAYTGLDPENENQRKFIDFLGKNGYKPVVKDIRKFGDGRMKANLDIELVVDLFRLADRMDVAVIVSGDGDFAPAIKALQDKGIRAEVISFKPNTSSDLIAVADVFTDIMKIASISRKEGRALRDAMPTPEMPAKEVNPEFGFREASPSVAAAALAAIKGGGATNGRRTRGSAGSGAPRRSAPAEAPADAPADAPSESAPADGSATTTTADSDEQTRRRRRRRGGRGRGRGRREGGEADSAAPTSGSDEIGWEELDDLSQVDGADADREFSFEEADAATLAELGIEVGADEAPAATDEAAETKPRRRSTRAKKADGDEAGDTATEAAETKPRRRSTRAKQADGDEAGDTATEAAETKPRRRSTRAKKADGDDGSATEGEAKPARRRSTRTKKADAGEPAGGQEAVATPADGDEPQGIWGRFRSARRPRTTTS